MKKETRTVTIEPTDAISSIFVARRDLLHGIKEVLAGSGLTVEESDLLISLYGVRKLGWDDLEHDPQGYVAFKQLERFLVHNPTLLSRRIRKMATSSPPLVEVIDANLEAGQHFNAKSVRITEEGMKRAKPVWSRYQQLSAILLDGIPEQMLKAHSHVNDEISKRIRAWRHGLSDSISRIS